VCAAVVVLTAACESTSLAPADPPVVEQVGQSTVRCGSGQIWAVVDYRAARQGVGGEWMVLDVAVTAADRQKVRLSRDRIFLRNPNGRRLPLLSQAEFLSSYTEIISSAHRVVA
jgi:hypothetical protein